MIDRMLNQLQNSLPRRIDLSPRRIAILTGAALLATALVYVLSLYAAARSADEAVDRQKAEFVSRYLERQEAGALDVLNRLAVSDRTFDAAHQGNMFVFAKYCDDKQLTGDLPSFGVVREDGSLISYCDYNRLGFEGAQSHFVKLADLTNLADFQTVLDDRDYYGQHLAEFHYRSEYVWSGDQLFLVVSALVSPSETRLLSDETRAPIILFGSLNIADTLRDADEQSLGLDAPVISATEDLFEQPNGIVLSTQSADRSALISWQPSNSYRSQFFGMVPFVLTLIAGLAAVAVFGFLRFERLQQEIREKDASVRHASQHDSMTGLVNRSYFSTVLDKLLSTGDVTRNIYVGLLDLDYFKSINDTYGHDVGDELIICVAHRIRDALGKGNVAARLGGDEFAFIITSAKTNDEAKALLDSLYERIAAEFAISAGTITPSASVGVARRSTKLNSRPDLLKAADHALYEAKRNGRNQYALSWAPKSTTQTAKKLETADA